MAVTDTDTASRGAEIATEILASRNIAANLPDYPFMSMVHTDSIDGVNGAKKDYIVSKDHGAASAGTEGTAITPVELALAATPAISVTPTEGVATQIDVTEDVLLERGTPSALLSSALRSDDPDMWMAILSPFIAEMVPMGLEKMENDGLALLDNIGNTVGGGATNDLTASDMIQAIFQLDAQNPKRPAEESQFLLAINSIQEVVLELAYTSGGLSGALWNTQADASLVNYPRWIQNGVGFAGTFFGRPVRRIAGGLENVVTGASWGAYGNFGIPGVAPDAPELAGRCGGFVLLERHGLMFRTEVNVTTRTISVVMNARYAFAEVSDTELVGITSDD